MILGPVRALLAAHATGVRNRMRREIGRNGLLLFGLGMVALLLTSVGPLLVGLALGGHRLGRALPRPLASETLGALTEALALFGGLFSGVLGGTRQLTWESYRTFPLARRHLLAAELVAGLGDMVPLLLSSGIVVLLAGVTVARPSLAPLSALLALEGVAIVLTVQLAVGGLAAALVKRVRALLVVAGALVGVGALLPFLVERAGLVAIGRALRALLAVLPLSFAARGLSEASEGRWLVALARHLYPLGVIALLVALDAWLLGREREQRLDAGVEGLPVRRWRFQRPAGGVAELHLQQLLASPIGRFGLAMPLITVFLVRGPLAHIVGRPAWVVPASYAYVALSAMQFQTSLFGLDGHGIKALFTLPVRADELLAGKIRGLAAYQAIQGAVLTLLLALLYRPPASALLAGALMAVAAAALQLSLGQFTSSWMPRPLARHAAQKSGVPLPLLLASSLSWMAISGALGTFHTALATRAPGALVPAMAVVAALALALLRGLRPLAARYLGDHQERILERIGG